MSELPKSALTPEFLSKHKDLAKHITKAHMKGLAKEHTEGCVKGHTKALNKEHPKAHHEEPTKGLPEGHPEGLTEGLCYTETEAEAKDTLSSEQKTVHSTLGFDMSPSSCVGIWETWNTP